MKRILISTLSLICISCSTNSQESDKALISTGKEIASIEVNLPLNPSETISFKEPYNPHSPYHLDLKIENTETDAKQLEVFITLKEDAHFVSPNAKRDFKGKFSMKLEESSDIKSVGELIEIPLSAEEIDTHHFVNGTVNWVRENTTYKLPLKVLKENDFEVSGLIKFTIEPRCSLEEIPFIVSQKSGKLTVTFAGGC